MMKLTTRAESAVDCLVAADDPAAVGDLQQSAKSGIAGLRPHRPRSDASATAIPLFFFFFTLNTFRTLMRVKPLASAFATFTKQNSDGIQQ